MDTRQLRTFGIALAVLFVFGLTAAGAVRAERFMGSNHGGRPLAAELTGAAEVPGPGDPDGTGTAEITLNLGQQAICYELAVSGIAPATMAHIHRGAAGATGPVVVNFSPPSSGSSSGCVENVDRALIKEILQNPAGFYVNVHNADFGPGAVRGQLS